MATLQVRIPWSARWSPGTASNCPSGLISRALTVLDFRRRTPEVVGSSPYVPPFRRRTDAAFLHADGQFPGVRTARSLFVQCSGCRRRASRAPAIGRAAYLGNAAPTGYDSAGVVAKGS